MVTKYVVGTILVLVTAPAALAHDAPTGWRYEAVCCSGRDCRPISSRFVEATDRGWQITLTGDVIPFSQARRSQDGAFHWCTVDGRDDSKTICLYAPDMLN